MDQQLSTKFQQKLQDLKRKWNKERGIRNIDHASRDLLQSGIALQANRDAIAENMREMIEKLFIVAKQHQELRQIRYTNTELKAIDESISSLLEGYLRETKRGFEASMASKGNHDSNVLSSISNRLSQTQTECTPLRRLCSAISNFINHQFHQKL